MAEWDTTDLRVESILADAFTEAHRRDLPEPEEAPDDDDDD